MYKLQRFSFQCAESQSLHQTLQGHESPMSGVIDDLRHLSKIGSPLPSPSSPQPQTRAKGGWFLKPSMSSGMGSVLMSLFSLACNSTRLGPFIGRGGSVLHWLPLQGPSILPQHPDSPADLSIGQRRTTLDVPELLM